MINITVAAARQIQQAALSSNTEGLALRLAVRELPDHSLDYGMGFDTPKPTDISNEIHGITVIIAPQYQEILSDLTLDYVELNPGEFRFIFQNPNDPQHNPALRAQ